jgi:hypothetical protein
MITLAHIGRALVIGASAVLLSASEVTKRSPAAKPRRAYATTYGVHSFAARPNTHNDLLVETKVTMRTPSPITLDVPLYCSRAS